MAGAFPAGYRDSRAAFLHASRDLGLHVESFEHPLAGSDGAKVSTDVASVGAPDASRVLFIVCGTHGVEGLCGAGMQLGVMRGNLAQTSAPLRLVFVHALNPHGFLDLRRTNEDNVDLNRNFIDHSVRPPRSSAYAEVHPMLVPEDWDGAARAEADAQLARFVAQRGSAALQAAVSGGQYDYPDGLFYGGRAPAWSNLLWRKLLREYAGRARLAGVIDFHSGLGARGACEVISGAVSGSVEFHRARRWFGDDIVFPGSTSTAPAAVGFMGTSLAEALPRARSALIVAEIGTVAFQQIFDVLRADNWIHSRGQRGSRLWRETKARMEQAFVGRDREWQQAVLAHADAICRRAVAGLLDTPDYEE
ncbi:MAG TPA: DUF2817 domain-containing protein [Steroidobacteraceae bacterium]|nr:DUF2817 domain-containing protein [Steroidobacteraceae bacterium]